MLQTRREMFEMLDEDGNESVDVHELQRALRYDQLACLLCVDTCARVGNLGSLCRSLSSAW